MAERNLPNFLALARKILRKSPNSSRYASEASASSATFQGKRPVRNSAGFTLKSTERALWLLFCVCAASFLVAAFEKRAFSQEAIREFRASVNPALDTDQFDAYLRRAIFNPDQSTWSTERVVSFEEHAPASEHAAIGVLSIPKLALEAPVFEGALDSELERGPGRIRGTGDIGSTGNIGIAGHRDGYFRSLAGIEPGDLVEVLGRDSATIYQVTDTWIVDPDAVHVLDPTEAASLTLVTCYPFYFVGPAPQRFIVRAVAVAD